MNVTNAVVDVIIPVYNGAVFLGEAIQSVADQSYTSTEIFVVDDDSTDDSAAVAAAFPAVHLLQQPHRGIGAALNLGLGQGAGEFVAFLDADDRWLPAKLEKQVAVLRADPTLDMAFGHVRQFIHGAATEEPTENIQPGLSRCSLLTRRSSLDRVGLFTEDPGLHVFVDWYTRAQEAGMRAVMLPDLLFERRIHATNLGRRTPDAQRQSYLRALRLSIARRAGEKEILP